MSIRPGLRIYAPALLALAISGCSSVLPPYLQKAASTPNADEIRTLATPTPIPTPVPTGTPVPPLAGAPVGRGEIVFLRNGRLWAAQPDSSGERPVVTAGSGSIGRGFAAAPSGDYVAFVVDGDTLALLDTASGQVHEVDSAPDDLIGALTWASDGSYLSYFIVKYKPDDPTVASVQIWQVAMPPGGPNLPIANSVFGITPNGFMPVAGLDGQRVILTQFSTNDVIYSQALILDPASGFKQLFPPNVAVRYKVWDVTRDRSQVLIGEDNALLVAPLGASQTGSLRQISPWDGAVYSAARFAPDGGRVVALRTVLNAGGEEVTRAVLLAPSARSSYPMIILGAADPGSDTALAWHSESGLVVQRDIPDEDAPSLWFVPLDGQPGRRITSGSDPVVLP